MPDFAPREEYGYIKAYVSSISGYPITGQRIHAANSELFLSTLDERESYLQVEITFIPEAQAQSRLKWSNPKSGNIKVAMGTMCQADIVVEDVYKRQVMILYSNKTMVKFRFPSPRQKIPPSCSLADNLHGIG